MRAAALQPTSSWLSKGIFTAAAAAGPLIVKDALRVVIFVSLVHKDKLFLAMCVQFHTLVFLYFHLLYIQSRNITEKLYSRIEALDFTIGSPKTNTQNKVPIVGKKGSI